MKQNLLCVAIRVALNAGKAVMDIYTLPTADFSVEMKADNSPITLADKAAHRAIYSQLQTLGIPVLSEEGEFVSFDCRKNWHTLWVVDPLDGTKEFIKRNGEFTINIALVENGVPTMGVIYVPVKKTLYFAEVNEGAFRMDDVECVDELSLQEIKQKSRELPLLQQREDFVVVASRSHLSTETQLYIDEKRKEYSSLQTISSGSSLKICLVAEGSADTYPRFAPTKEWDTAAGHAIARVAGCVMYNPETQKELVYNKPDLLNPWFVVERK